MVHIYLEVLRGVQKAVTVPKGWRTPSHAERRITVAHVKTATKSVNG